MRIRPATLEDSRALGRVQLDSWHTLLADYASDDYWAQFSYNQRESSWRNFLTTNTLVIVYVAENPSGEVVGYVQATRRSYKQYDSEIDSIHIDEAYRGQGVGQQLIAAVARHLYAEGHCSLMLWVMRENRARRFYERLGGIAFDEKPLDLGKTPTTEVAYGWGDSTLLF